MQPVGPYSPRTPFSEKEFYLAEFRGRTLGLALSDVSPGACHAVQSVLADLDANGTRSVLLARNAEVLAQLCGTSIVDADDPRWLGAVWRAFRGSPRVGLIVRDEKDLALRARLVAVGLRLAKLVWLETSGPLERSGGARLSYVDRVELDRLLEGSAETLGESRRDLLREIREMVAEGVPSVAICSPLDLAGELFTYAGAGTFFTRERYIEVRALGIDEFDAACDLIGRGVEEGYLVARREDELESILTNAFGVFVEGRYLAGIGALMPHPVERAGELCSLYTLTRFVGGGVGGRLVGHALERARAAGFEYVYACTTSDRVERFFGDHGFARVDPSAIPADKWQGYPEERRARVRCLRRDV